MFISSLFDQSDQNDVQSDHGLIGNEEFLELSVDETLFQLSSADKEEIKGYAKQIIIDLSDRFKTIATDDMRKTAFKAVDDILVTLSGVEDLSFDEAALPELTKLEDKFKVDKEHNLKGILQNYLQEMERDLEKIPQTTPQEEIQYHLQQFRIGFETVARHGFPLIMMEDHLRKQFDQITDITLKSLVTDATRTLASKFLECQNKDKSVGIAAITSQHIQQKTIREVNGKLDAFIRKRLEQCYPGSTAENMARSPRSLHPGLQKTIVESISYAIRCSQNRSHDLRSIAVRGLFIRMSINSQKANDRVVAYHKATAFLPDIDNMYSDHHRYIYQISEGPVILAPANIGTAVQVPNSSHNPKTAEEMHLTGGETAITNDRGMMISVHHMTSLEGMAPSPTTALMMLVLEPDPADRTIPDYSIVKIALWKMGLASVMQGSSDKRLVFKDEFFSPPLSHRIRVYHEAYSRQGKALTDDEYDANGLFVV